MLLHVVRCSKKRGETTLLQWYRNMKVRTKLLMSSMIAVLFLVGTGWLGFYTMENMADGADEIYEQNMMPTLHLSEASNMAWLARGEVLLGLLSDDSVVQRGGQEAAKEYEDVMFS